MSNSENLPITRGSLVEQKRMVIVWRCVKCKKEYMAHDNKIIDEWYKNGFKFSCDKCKEMQLVDRNRILVSR